MRTPERTRPPVVPRATFLRQMTIICAVVMAVLLPLVYLFLRDLAHFSQTEALGTISVTLALFAAAVVRSVRRVLARYEQ